jgi:outer membrane protein assembly factor BamB
VKTLFLAIIAVTSTTAVLAQETVPKSSWASFRNGNEQRGVARTTLTEKPELLWELKSPDGWLSSAAIVDGRVYAPALEGYVYCLDLRTGKEIWKYRSIDNPDPKKFAAGFKAAPRVTRDTVYVGDEDGFFHAIDRKTGKKKWVFETKGEIAGCAAVVGENLLVPSHDASLYCLDPKGSQVWNFETQDRVNCSPALADNFTFVAGCDEHLRVIDIKKGEETLDIPLGSYLIASPALHGDVLYVGTYTGEVVAVNWKTGKFVWRYKGKRELEIHASAAVTDELVLVGGHDKIMHCIDRKSGKPRWTFPTNARINSSPAVVDKRVFFGSDDGNIYGLSLKDGKEVWKFTAGKDISAGMAIGDGCMVVGSAGSNGRLYCFGTKSPKDKKKGSQGK